MFSSIFFYICSSLMVPWPSGLGTGLQNRVQRFESARNLKKLYRYDRAFLFTFVLVLLA
jgi:hypothetical protein